MMSLGANNIQSAIFAARVKFPIDEPQSSNESSFVSADCLLERAALPYVDQRVSSTCVAETLVVVGGASEAGQLTCTAKDSIFAFARFIPELDMLGSGGYKRVVTLPC